MTSIMTISDVNSRPRHNSLDPIDVDDILLYSKEDEGTSSIDIRVDQSLDFSASEENHHIEFDEFEFSAFGYCPSSSSSARNRTTSVDSQNSLAQTRIRNRERGLSLEFSLLPTSIRDFDIDIQDDEIQPLMPSEFETVTLPPLVEARRTHLRTIKYHGKKPRDHKNSQRWKTQPAVAKTETGEQIKVHLKVIGVSKALAKQQNGIASTKKKLSLTNTKPTVPKLKKQISNRTKGIKVKTTETIILPSTAKPHVKPECVVVTSSMSPSKDTIGTTNTLSTSPIKVDGLKQIGNNAKTSIVQNGSIRDPSALKNRVKVEGHTSKKVQPVVGDGSTKLNKSSKQNLSVYFAKAKTAPKAISRKVANPNAKMIGRYSEEQRRERIRRFLEKRKSRQWLKKVKYGCRKKLADSRPRIKGRFVPRHVQDEVLARQRLEKGASKPSTQTNGQDNTAAEKRSSAGAQTPKPRVHKAKNRSLVSMSPTGVKTSTARRQSTPGERDILYSNTFPTSTFVGSKEYISLNLDDDPITASLSKDRASVKAPLERSS